MISVDSDYFVLELKPSTIPGVGLGVFAKLDIEPGIVIAEYRGSIILNEDRNVARFSDRCLYLNKDVIIAGNNCIASFVNDAIQFKETYTKGEIEEIEKNKHFPLYPDKNYNCVFMKTLFKAFIVTSKPIKQDEELFCDYGIKYWINRVKTIDS